MLITLTKNLLYKFHPESTIYGMVRLTSNKVLINGIKHVIFEHHFISAN